MWAAKTVKRPPQQPAQPQHANYLAPLTRKWHIPPHPAQPRHTDHWAPRTRQRHQQEHRPQQPTESSDPTQHAKGRTGDCPGPRTETATRRNVTRGVTCRSGHHPPPAGSPLQTPNPRQWGIAALPTWGTRARHPTANAVVAAMFYTSIRDGGVWPSGAPPHWHALRVLCWGRGGEWVGLGRGNHLDELCGFLVLLPPPPPPGRASFEQGGGEGGRGFWTQNLVYQKWPDQIFPIVNFVFSHYGPFGLGRGGGGFGGGVPPPLLIFNYSKEALP